MKVLLASLCLLVGCTAPGVATRVADNSDAGTGSLATVDAPRRSYEAAEERSSTRAVDGAGSPLADELPPIGLGIGMRAPSFAASLLDGRPISDADLRAQEKPYILYFYATW